MNNTKQVEKKSQKHSFITEISHIYNWTLHVSKEFQDEDGLLLRLKYYSKHFKFP